MSEVIFDYIRFLLRSVSDFGFGSFKDSIKMKIWFLFFLHIWIVLKDWWVCSLVVESDLGWTWPCHVCSVKHIRIWTKLLRHCSCPHWIHHVVNSHSNIILHLLRLHLMCHWMSHRLMHRLSCHELLMRRVHHWLPSSELILHLWHILLHLLCLFSFLFLVHFVHYLVQFAQLIMWLCRFGRRLSWNIVSLSEIHGE